MLWLFHKLTPILIFFVVSFLKNLNNVQSYIGRIKILYNKRIHLLIYGKINL